MAPARLVVVVACLGLGVAAWAASPASAAFPGANGKIAFASGRDGNLEIYSMNADGSVQANLTNNAAGDDNPGPRARPRP